MIHCKNCGKAFVPDHKKHIFCSRLCFRSDSDWKRAPGLKGMFEAMQDRMPEGTVRR